MVKRYRSVTTFNITVTKMSTLEIAGWQKSAPCQLHSEVHDDDGDIITAWVRIYLPVPRKRSAAQEDG